MFHKEGSCTDIISSSTSRGKGGGGKSKGKGKGKPPPPSKAQQLESPTSVSKAVDVPLRKSDRRKLRQRAAAYFFGESATSDSGAGNNAQVDADKDSSTPKDENVNPMETLLDEIFLRGGTLSSRSLPRPSSKATDVNESKTKGNHENMVLYVKSPSSSESDNNSNSNYWPYEKKPQFVWMALEDKKSGKILHETPSVALLAVIWHTLIFPNPEQAAFLDHFEKARIVTTHSPVSRYLCRGADLMRAGIISAPEKQAATEPPKGKPKKNPKKKDKESFADGGKDMVVICARGNPQPFAVGRSVLWSSHPSDNDKPYGYGTKGIGVEIWNCFGDDLWRTTIPAGGGGANLKEGDYPSLENGSYGNPGFCAIENSGELCVVPLAGHGEEEESDEGGDEEGVDGSERQKEEESTNEATASSVEAVSTEEKETEETETTSDVGHETPITAGEETVAPPQASPAEAIVTDDGDSDSSEEDAPSPDEILHTAVCQALVNLKKNDLPMLVGTFYTKHVMSNLPKGTEGGDLLKQTSYKKFGNYLKHWQVNNRDDSGLVQTGPDPLNRNNKDPNAVLVSFHRRHEDLHGMKKTKTTSGTDSADGNSKIALVKLYVVPQQWTNLLRLDPEETSASNASSEARRGSRMLTMPEVKKLLDGYLQRESSLMISKNMVALDGPLTDALYGKKSNEEAPEKLSRKDLSKKFVDRMSPAYCLVRMPGSHVIKLGRGTPPKVQIEVVKRQSKKFVTRLRGLEEYLGGSAVMDPSEFCKDVSKRLAISGSVDSDPAASGRAALPKKGCVEYVFGANIVDELEALLTGDESLSEHGGTKGKWAYPRIPGAVVEVVLRKGVPPRKKRRGGGGGKR